jgi:hypothetical protein
MSKKRKSFREAWEDDEWGSNEEYSRKRNDKNKRKVREKRKQKFADRWYDEDMNLKRKK